jgi:hypothetical protein
MLHTQFQRSTSPESKRPYCAFAPVQPWLLVGIGGTGAGNPAQPEQNDRSDVGPS